MQSLNQDLAEEDNMRRQKKNKAQQRTHQLPPAIFTAGEYALTTKSNGEVRMLQRVPGDGESGTTENTFSPINKLQYDPATALIPWMTKSRGSFSILIAEDLKDDVDVFDDINDSEVVELNKELRGHHGATPAGADNSHTMNAIKILSTMPKDQDIVIVSDISQRRVVIFRARHLVEQTLKHQTGLAITNQQDKLAAPEEFPEELKQEIEKLYKMQSMMPSNVVEENEATIRQLLERINAKAFLGEKVKIHVLTKVGENPRTEVDEIQQPWRLKRWRAEEERYLKSGDKDKFLQNRPIFTGRVRVRNINKNSGISGATTDESGRSPGSGALKTEAQEERSVERRNDGDDSAKLQEQMEMQNMVDDAAARAENLRDNHPVDADETVKQKLEARAAKMEFGSAAHAGQDKTHIPLRGEDSFAEDDDDIDAADDDVDEVDGRLAALAKGLNRLYPDKDRYNYTERQRTSSAKEHAAFARISHWMSASPKETTLDKTLFWKKS
eukprot:GSA120T00019685001.1